MRLLYHNDLARFEVMVVIVFHLRLCYFKITVLRVIQVTVIYWPKYHSRWRFSIQNICVNLLISIRIKEKGHFQLPLILVAYFEFVEKSFFSAGSFVKESK